MKIMICCKEMEEALANGIIKPEACHKFNTDIVLKLTISGQKRYGAESSRFIKFCPFCPKEIFIESAKEKP